MTFFQHYRVRLFLVMKEVTVFNYFLFLSYTNTRVVTKVSNLAYVKLGTSGLWIGNWTGAGVTATLQV